MKLLLSLLLLLTSLKSFGQETVNSIDLVLFSDYAETSKEAIMNLARLEITRERYNRILKEDLILQCKITTDKDTNYLFYQGQVGVKNKRARNPFSQCSTTACQTTKFEDLAELKTEAGMYVGIPGDGKGNNYILSSIAHYDHLKDLWSKGQWPEASEIPHVVIFDPKIHNPKDVPVVNTFYCRLMNPKNETVSP